MHFFDFSYKKILPIQIFVVILHAFSRKKYQTKPLAIAIGSTE